MLSVTFKNVGQGDSIVIEWKDGGQRIGILDCNNNNGNPVLKYIKALQPETIDFIILSHPHLDHFSGMLELIEYCHQNNIHIKHFLQTCSHFSSKFLSAALKSATAHSAYSKLIKYVNKSFVTYKTGVGLIQADAPNSYLNLGKSKLTFLSPTYSDVLKYINKDKYKFDEEDAHSHPLANMLSTICRIETKEGYVLLTADTLIYQLDRLLKKLDGEMVLGQSPHHGSGYNHASNFWHSVKRKSNTPIVFSVGLNKHGHPARKSIDSFLKNGYKIYSTNEVGYLKGSAKHAGRSAIMDSFSTRKLSKGATELIGDQKFEFEI